MKKILIITIMAIVSFLIILFTLNKPSPQVMVYELNNKSAVGSERIDDTNEIDKWISFHEKIEKIGIVVPGNDFSFDNVNFQVKYDNGNKEVPVTFIYDIIFSKDYVLVRDSYEFTCYKIPIEVFESYNLLNFKNK